MIKIIIKFKEQQSEKNTTTIHQLRGLKSNKKKFVIFFPVSCQKNNNNNIGHASINNQFQNSTTDTKT